MNAGTAARLIAVALAWIAAGARGTGHAQETESRRFREFLDQAYRGLVDRSPLLASEFGEQAGAGRWDDVSEAGLAREAGIVRKQLDEAKSGYSYDKLDRATQLRFRVFVDESQLLLDRYSRRDEFYPLNQIVGLHLQVADVLINQQPLNSVADARVYIRRISAVRTLMDQLTVRMTAQAARGIYIPKSVYPLRIDGAQNVTTTDMTPEDVHSLGLQEVSRVHREIEQVMRRLGVEGSVRDFMSSIREDPRFYNENSEAGRQAESSYPRAASQPGACEFYRKIGSPEWYTEADGPYGLAKVAREQIKQGISRGSTARAGIIGPCCRMRSGWE
jgi:uncharacterized protein (DUF885 family)